MQRAIHPPLGSGAMPFCDTSTMYVCRCAYHQTSYLYLVHSRLRKEEEEVRWRALVLWLIRYALPCKRSNCHIWKTGEASAQGRIRSGTSLSRGHKGRNTAVHLYIHTSNGLPCRNLKREGGKSHDMTTHVVFLLFSVWMTSSDTGWSEYQSRRIPARTALLSRIGASEGKGITLVHQPACKEAIA